jgi:hypothetical protein
MFCGRTVRQWLASKDYETNRVAVSLAIAAFGDRSVPALRRMLHSGTRWERVWFAKAPRWLYRRLPFGGYQFERKDRAMWALRTLGREGGPATPDLLVIAQDTTEQWNQRYGAITTLRDIQAQPSLVLPVMDRLADDPALGKYATNYAGMLRRVAEDYKRGQTWGAAARSGSTSRETPTPEFQPSKSFLDNSSLWGPTHADRKGD